MAADVMQRRPGARIRGAVLAALIAPAAQVAALIAPAAQAVAAVPVVDRVRAAGALACGVVAELTDWDRDDHHSGLDDFNAEWCKAVAVAVLGDAARVNRIGFGAEREGLAALHRGAVDVLMTVSPTASAAARYRVRFGPPVFHDSLAILVPAAAGLRRLADLDGKVLCLLTDDGRLRRIRAAARRRGITLRYMLHQEEGEMDAALVVGRCQAMLADLSVLADDRAGFHAKAGDYVFLPERLSLDPVAPAYRDDDPAWGRIVDWTVAALIQAEASGVTRANVGAMRGTGDADIERLTGEDFATAQALGLPRDWSARVIAALGNYGEIYRRTLGEGSPLGLPRGLNALWTNGGLIYPLPGR